VENDEPYCDKGTAGKWRGEGCMPTMCTFCMLRDSLLSACFPVLLSILNFGLSFFHFSTLDMTIIIL